MKRLKIHMLIDLVEDLYILTDWGAKTATAGQPIPETDRPAVLSYLKATLSICKELGFRGPLVHAERCEAKIKAGCTFREMKDLCVELRSRIKDEFVGTRVMWIDQAQYFERDDLFGEQVAQHFTEASIDIAEAGKCYAVGRYTACVYHAMRVAEHGLKAIAKRVDFPIPPDGRLIWERVLAYIDAELKKSYLDRKDVFKGDMDWLADVSAQMHAVNVAWRRRVAHIERTYTPDQAERIFNATKGLMQHLSEKLTDVKEEDESSS